MSCALRVISPPNSDDLRGGVRVARRRFLEADVGKNYGYPFCWTEYKLSAADGGKGAGAFGVPLLLSVSLRSAAVSECRGLGALTWRAGPALAMAYDSLCAAIAQARAGRGRTS